MESITDAYKEACMLELKYKHLFQVCKSLLHSWPNRDQHGRTVKKEQRKESAPKKDESQVEESNKDDLSKAKEVADLQVLDNILCRAQKIREGGKRTKAKATTATSITMATLAYGQSKPLTSKRASVTKSKAISSSTKVSERDNKSKPNTTASQTRLQPTSNHTHPIINHAHPITDCTTSDHIQDEGSFCLQTNGQGLSMMSRYSKMKQLLVRINDQQKQQAASQITPSSHITPSSQSTPSKQSTPSSHITPSTQSTRSEGSQHFTQRLLSQESVGQSVAIETLLVVEEYAVIKEELLKLSPKELAASDKLSWQDLLRLKTQLDASLTTVERLSTKTNPPAGCKTHKLTKHCSSNSSKASEQFCYSELKKLKQLCALEQQLLLENWEMKFVEFIGESVIPLLECEQQRLSSDVCELLQCIYQLLGATQSETVNYVRVDH